MVVDYLPQPIDPSNSVKRFPEFLGYHHGFKEIPLLLVGFVDGPAGFFHELCQLLVTKTAWLVDSAVHVELGVAAEDSPCGNELDWLAMPEGTVFATIESKSPVFTVVCPSVFVSKECKVFGDFRVTVWVTGVVVAVHDRVTEVARSSWYLGRVRRGEVLAHTTRCFRKPAAWNMFI